MDGSWLDTWRTVHVVVVIVFLVGHALSMYAGFRFKSVATVEQAVRVLDLSRVGLLIAHVGLLVVIVAGILAGIAGQWFLGFQTWLNRCTSPGSHDRISTTQQSACSYPETDS